LIKRYIVPASFDRSCWTVTGLFLMWLLSRIRQLTRNVLRSGLYRTTEFLLKHGRYREIKYILAQHSLDFSAILEPMNLDSIGNYGPVKDAAKGPKKMRT
jgi:hypothetical protein